MSTLREWFDTPLGRRLLQQEKRVLDSLLPQLFGYHLVQIGCVGGPDWLAASRIKHRCRLATPYLPGTGEEASAQCAADSLPIAGDSVDVVVLAHVLEFELQPHQVLREVERILIPEGHMLLVGFNPLSLWGLRRLAEFRRRSPWQGRFRTASRIKDWLALLGFELVSQHSVLFAPPFDNRLLQRQWGFLEASGRRWWPYLGAAYILLAKKRVATLTPIKPRWLSETKSVLAGNAARPSGIRRDRKEP